MVLSKDYINSKHKCVWNKPNNTISHPNLRYWMLKLSRASRSLTWKTQRKTQKWIGKLKTQTDMKRLLTLLALVLCSCAETFVGEEATRPNNGNLPDLTAAFAEEDNTRTYIEDGKYLRWHEDDRLTIFFGNTLNRQYKFNGATGDNSGTFSLVPDGMLGTGNAFDRIYALYPYNADVRITDEGVISLTLPAEQTYAENSFGRGANTMLAVTENLEDTFLAFKNACGYLKLKLYNAEGATIKSIEVKGNSGERLAGAATATIVFGEAPIVTMIESATDTITLNCGEGVALGTTAETATEFWVTLPATTFAEGLTITATDTEGGVFEKSTTNEVIIERNAIQPMAVLEAKFVATKPANNEIWYTNGSTTEATTPYKTDVFGANIVSNTYDDAKECWIIKFDGEVTTIGGYAFYECSSLTSVTIPDSVTSIGERAFYSCESLISVTIPNSVTEIGQYTFYNCSSLTSVTIPDSGTKIKHCAFERCSSLTSVTIPDSITGIAEFTFNNCSSLTSVYCKPTTPPGGSFGMFDGNASGRKIYVPMESVEAYKNAYRWSDYADAIVGYDFENGVAVTPKPAANEIWYTTTDGEMASVYDIEYIVKSYVGSYYTHYYDETNGVWVLRFDDLEKLWKFPNVDYQWFFSDNVSSVIMPDCIEEITGLEGLPNLTTITLSTNLKTIDTRAFNGCSSLAEIAIPNSVTEIRDYTFQGCSSLASITIPHSVTSIGQFAFDGCNNIKNLTIPDGVSTIYISSLPSLNSLTIGSNVTSIQRDDNRYYACSTIYCKPTTPPNGLIGNNGLIFEDVVDITTIYVPRGCADSYTQEIDNIFSGHKPTVIEIDF